MKNIFAIILLCMPLALLAQQNFSDTWKLDKGKSKFNNVQNAEANAFPEIIVTQTADSITFVCLTNQQVPIKAIYPINGSSIQSDQNSPDRKIHKSASVAMDGSKKQLTISAKYDVDEGRKWSYSRISVEQLSPDSKTLTMIQTSVLPDRTEDITLVYIKQ